MDLEPRPTPGKTIEEHKEFVSNWTFDRFVTLVFNEPPRPAKISRAWHSDAHIWALKEKAKAWDARINRRLVGRDWAKLHDYRTFSFFFLEKSVDHPHWHCLVKFFNVDDAERERQAALFDRKAEGIWKALVRSGTVDVKAITHNTGAISYVAKSLIDRLNWEHYIAPDEFWRR